jgi:signal transduction histidine kinase
MDPGVSLAGRRAGAMSNALILRAFAVVAVCFAGGAVVPQWLDRSIAEGVNTIVLDAAPSVTHLADARSELYRLRDLTIDYVEGEGNKLLLADVTRSRDQLAGAIQAYLSLPFAPGEREAWEAVAAAIQSMDQLVDRAVGAVDAGDIALARKLVTTDLRAVVGRADAALRIDTQINADMARAAADRIEQQRRTSLVAASALCFLGVISTAFAALRVARINSQHRALEADYARTLEERNLELDKFASRLAHDIVSPLAATMLAIDVLLRRTTDVAMTRQLATARAGADRARRISSALLDFARAGAQPASGEHADVHTVCLEVIDELRPTAAKAGVACTNDTPSGLEVACSPALLLIVISNFVRNAIKYMGDVEERCVGVTARTVSRAVRIEVADTGPGLAGDLEHHVFEPYVRGTTTKNGLGLGLATVKRIVEAHGGAVGVETSRGHGCRFWVELPRPAV